MILPAAAVCFSPAHFSSRKSSFIRIQLCTMWQLGETRFLKENGVGVSEEDQLLELGSWKLWSRPDTGINYFHDFSSKMKQSVFKNAHEITFLELLLWLGRETTL